MSLQIYAYNPNKLIINLKKAIDEGNIVTWSYDQDGDFSHTPAQWINQAWLRPKIYNDKLEFNIIKPSNKTITSLVYAVYHGRFLETFLTHFDTDFTSATVSALPTDEDIIT